VQRLEEGDELERGLGGDLGDLGGVADQEADAVGHSRLGRCRAGLGDRCLVQVDPQDPGARVGAGERDRGGAEAAAQVQHAGRRV
jgi:hypothetical protein